MCPVLRSFVVAMVGLSFSVKPIRSQLQLETKVLSPVKPPSWIGVGKQTGSDEQKRGRPWNPAPRSQAHVEVNFFTLTY